MAMAPCYNRSTRMRDMDPFRDWPEDEGMAAGDGRLRRDFDPLFSTGDEPAHEDLPAPAGDFLSSSSDYSWEAPASLPGWQEISPYDQKWAAGASRPTSWYANRWGEAYEPALTEAQQRLWTEVITIPRPERRRWAVTARELAETLLLALLIFLSVRASFQNFRVEGASMYPSLENGEYLIVNKLSYAQLDTSIFNFLPFYDAGDAPLKHIWGEPDRGDIIVFRAPTSPNRDFIKRIIGLPGDTIQITESGEVILNGEVLDEPYITGITNCNSTCEPLTIPAAGSPGSHAKCGSDACYFVMGDNRQNSSDSRQGWLVPEENIIGKALITYWHEGGPEFDVAPNHSVSAREDGQ